MSGYEPNAGISTEAKDRKPVAEMSPAELAAFRKTQEQGRRWNRQNPVHPDNVIAHWNSATESEKNSGMDWYRDAHEMTKHIAKDTGHSMDTAAGLMSTYSPQTHWATNMMNASKAMRLRRGIGGPGSGVMATKQQRSAANRLMGADGHEQEHYEQVLKGPKTKAFARLIHHGGNADPEKPDVVIDRHALSVAAGARASDSAYEQSGLGGVKRYREVANVYHKAAAHISKHTGVEVHAHQVQAATWLVRQRLNSGEDARTASTAKKGRDATEEWNSYAGEHHPLVMGKEPGTGYGVPTDAPDDVQHSQVLHDEGTHGGEVMTRVPPTNPRRHPRLATHVADGQAWAKPEGEYPSDWSHTPGNEDFDHPHGVKAADTPVYLTRHPETRAHQVVDRHNRLITSTNGSDGSNSEHYDATNHTSDVFHAINTAHGHQPEVASHDYEAKAEFERAKPPFAHSTTDPRIEGYKARPEARVQAPVEGSHSPHEEWHGPYEVVKHPETGKFHVVDNQNRHANAHWSMSDRDKAGHDTQWEAESRRDHVDRRTQGRERAKGMADSLFNSTMDIMDPGGTEESRRSESNASSLNGLMHRYEGGNHHPLTPGKFGADDHDKEGDGDGQPYYEVTDPGGSGWKARDYGGANLHIHHEATGEDAHDLTSPSGSDHGSLLSPGSKPAGFGHEELHQHLQHWIHGDPADGEDQYAPGPDYARANPKVERWQKRKGYTAMKRTAYGETKAPMNVDTLREENCPVCSEHDAYDGDQCSSCGFVTPPEMFRDPDLSKAKMLDLRADPASGAPNDQSHDLPPVDPTAVDGEGEVVEDPEGEVEPGSEGGEVQSEEDESEDGIVDGEVRGLGDQEDPDDPDDTDEDDAPVDPDDVDEEGEVPDEDEGPVEPGGQAEDGQVVDGDPTEPGTPGDGVADLLCPSCGFEADAAHPTSTPNNSTEPANAGDGMLAGDLCPNCQKATLMSIGEVSEMQQAQPQGI